MSVYRDCQTTTGAGTAIEDVSSAFQTDALRVYLDSLGSPRYEQALVYDMFLQNLVGHSFVTTSGRFRIAHPGLKPGDQVCAFYGDENLHILRWPTTKEESPAEHANKPAEFCGVAFVPYLME